jgi:hypothetical protein
MRREKMGQGKIMVKKVKKLLYRSFDEDLSDAEKSNLEKALEGSEELRKDMAEINRQRQALSQNEGVSFEPMFAERVINRLSSPPMLENGLEAFYETFKNMFRKIAIAGAVTMLVLISYNLTIGDQITEEEAFFASDITYEELSRLPLFY